MELDFGRHKGLTIKQVASIDPKYIQYLLSSTGRISEEQREECFQLITDMPITFGKHKGLSFKFVKHTDPDYLRWASRNLRYKQWLIEFLAKPE